MTKTGMKNCFQIPTNLTKKCDFEINLCGTFRWAQKCTSMAFGISENLIKNTSQLSNSFRKSQGTSSWTPLEASVRVDPSGKQQSKHDPEGSNGQVGLCYKSYNYVFQSPVRQTPRRARGFLFCSEVPYLDANNYNFQSKEAYADIPIW